MRVTVQNTRADFIALSERAAQFRLGRAYKFMRRVYPIFCLILSLLWFWFFFLVFYWPSMPAVMIFQAIYTGLGLLASTWMWPILYAISFATAKRKRRFGLPLTIDLRPNGIEIQQDEQRFILWSEFRDVSRDEQHLFLICKGLNINSFVIPDRAFQSPAEAESFFQATLHFWLQSNSSHAPIAAP